MSGKIINNTTATLFIVLALSGCVSYPDTSGFLIKPATSLTPNTTVIIYSHGTRNSQRRENCHAYGNQIPNSLRAIANETTLIYFLCSQVKEGIRKKTAGEYIYKRVNELDKVITRLYQHGIKPHNIFLAGHSAGAWSSLMAKRYLNSKFNGVIAFAPAFAGKRSAEKKYPWWRQRVRPAQIQDMLKTPLIKALVFAYDGDAYNRPQDLRFLTNKYPNTVTMVAYRCNNHNPHLTHIEDCRQRQTTQAIVDFIREANKHD
jgi:pimeloyl-ACP methyl ester carboxylesterase